MPVRFRRGRRAHPAARRPSRDDERGDGRGGRRASVTVRRTSTGRAGSASPEWIAAADGVAAELVGARRAARRRGGHRAAIVDRLRDRLRRDRPPRRGGVGSEPAARSPRGRGDLRVRAAGARVRRRARAVDGAARRHRIAVPCRSRSCGAPCAVAAETRSIVGSGRDHLDQRHHRRAEGRVVRPRQPAGRGHDRRRDERAVRPPPGADALRPRRVHGQAVGAAGVGDDARDQPDAVDRRRDGARSSATERITVAGGVPTQWAKLARAAGARHRRHSVRCASCVAATAPAPPELVERVTRRASGARWSCATR